MLSFRSVTRTRAARSVAAETVAPEVDEVVETPLVPCNNLRARWITTEDGSLELRWDLVQPVTSFPARPATPERRSA